MSLIAGFRRDFTSTLFSLSGKVFLNFVFGNLIVTALTYLILGLIFASALNWSGLMALGENPDLIQDLMSNPLDLVQFIFGDISMGKLIGLGTVAGILMIIVTAWSTTLYFKINDKTIRQGKASFGEVMKESLSNKIFTVLGAMFLLMIIYVGLYLVVVVIAMASPITLILTLPALMIVLMKFMLTFPAIIHGDLSITEGLAYSWNNMTWKRAALLFLIGIGVGIGLVIAMMIVGFILGILSLIPFLGIVIQMVGNVIIGAYITALVNGTMSGLYFRYSDDEESGGHESGMDLEDHLITDPA